jgi:hypothetical protein
MSTKTTKEKSTMPPLQADVIANSVKTDIVFAEARIADYAGNLAKWFGKDRTLTEIANPAMPFESQYVKSMLDKMNGEYRNLLQLQAKLTEFEMNSTEKETAHA